MPFECCYCGKRIATEADLISPCELGPGGWHYAEPPMVDDWAPAVGRWAKWD